MYRLTWYFPHDPRPASSNIFFMGCQQEQLNEDWDKVAKINSRYGRYVACALLQYYHFVSFCSSCQNFSVSFSGFLSFHITVGL